MAQFKTSDVTLYLVLKYDILILNEVSTLLMMKIKGQIDVIDVIGEGGRGDTRIIGKAQKSFG